MLGIIIGVLFSLVIAGGLAVISLVGCRLIAFWSLFIIFLLGLLTLLFIAIWYFLATFEKIVLLRYMRYKYRVLNDEIWSFG